MKHKPITYSQEPCEYSREGIREATIEVFVTGAIEHRNPYDVGRRDCLHGQRQHPRHRFGETAYRSTVSEIAGPYVRISLGPRRPLSVFEVFTKDQAQKAGDFKSCGVRDRRIRWGHNGDEGSERGKTCGAAGAKALAREEAGKFYYTPYTEVDKRVPWGQAATAVLQSETAVQPEGGAGCVSAYVRICAGGLGKPEFLPRPKAIGNQPPSVNFFSLGKRVTALRRKLERLSEYSFKVVRYPLKYRVDSWMAFFKDRRSGPKLYSRHGSMPPFTISDKRWCYGVLPEGNANLVWGQQVVDHLTPKGFAGFMLTNGPMSSNQFCESGIRRFLIKEGLADCMVSLPGQLFCLNQISVRLWYLVSGGQRQEEGLFTDTSKVCRMVDREHYDLIAEDIAPFMVIYHVWRTKGCGYVDMAGFCLRVQLDRVASTFMWLTPGRYVGVVLREGGNEPFGNKMKRLTSEQLSGATKLEASVTENLQALGFWGGK